MERIVIIGGVAAGATAAAKEADLEIGTSGGLLVNSRLQTSDPDIYAAGDMVEIEHRVNGRKVRIPLAGPANRHGRIAAENALGGTHAYKGALGTSVVRVFEAVAGITGLSLKQALEAGYDADAVVVHKEHHTSYFPGAETVSVLLVFDRSTGIVLGGQTAGYKGTDKRLDVIATAVASKLTVSDLADLDSTLIVYDETGKKGHQALRMLQGEGFIRVYNVSGGHTSLQRHARGLGFSHIQIDLLPVEA